MNRKTYVGLIGLLVLFSFASGQIPDRSSILDRLGDQRALQSLMGRETTVDQTRAQPMEGPIDPNTYIVGPSDVLNVGLWGPVSNNYSVTVTPEGSIILPTVGEIHVLQMKLADVKKEVMGIVKRKYPSSAVTVTLLRPRSFLVALRGSVLKPGQYAASHVDRLEKVLFAGSEAVYPASTVTIPGLTMIEGEQVLTKMESYETPILKQTLRLAEETSTRNIRLIRKNGDTLRVDLPKYYVTGEERLNPFLLDGDVILVPNRDIGRNYISVRGAVNTPGDYEYSDRDSLLGIIAIAGGFSSVADEEHIVVSRIDSEGNPVSEVEYSVATLRSGGQPNPKIERGDRVFVKSRLTVSRRYEVIVAGEVRNPGSYPILLGKTKLTKIVQDAGGFTDRALQSGAFVLRSADKLKDFVDSRFDLVRALRTHQLDMLDSLLFLYQLKVGREPVVVDFKKLFVDRDTTQDILLEKGDIVYIPSDFDAVVVQGQIAQSGYVTYAPGKDYMYYIAKAGGFAELADESEVKVIKKATLQWIDPSDTVIESGDQIWVPKHQKKDFRYYFSWVKEGAAIVGSFATLVYLAIAINK